MSSHNQHSPHRIPSIGLPNKNLPSTSAPTPASSSALTVRLLQVVMKMMVTSSVMMSGVKQSADTADCDDPHTSPPIYVTLRTLDTGATWRDILIKLSPTQLENNYFLQPKREWGQGQSFCNILHIFSIENLKFCYSFLHTMCHLIFSCSLVVSFMQVSTSQLLFGYCK